MHFPFCKHRCAYCSFVSSTDFSLQEEYYYRLKAEISSRVPYGESDTLYFGGGTPTALEACDIERIIKAVRRYLPLANDCEITYEGRLSGFGTDKMEAALAGGAIRRFVRLSAAAQIRKP